MATTPFKSDRAAKLAFRKVEKTAKAARDARVNFDCAQRETGWSEEAFAESRRLKAIEDTAWETASQVYNRVRAEGFWVRSWHFGYNPTRDLISQNID